MVKPIMGSTQHGQHNTPKAKNEKWAWFVGNFQFEWNGFLRFCRCGWICVWYRRWWPPLDRVGKLGGDAFAFYCIVICVWFMCIIWRCVACMRDSGKRSSKVNTKHTENARHFAWKIREIREFQRNSLSASTINSINGISMPKLSIDQKKMNKQIGLMN